LATADGSYTPGLVACGLMTTVAARKKLNLQRHLGGLLRSPRSMETPTKGTVSHSVKWHPSTSREKSALRVEMRRKRRLLPIT